MDWPQVLTITRYRLEDGLSDLLTAGLAEERYATTTESAMQGAVTISALGIMRLSEYEASIPDRLTAAIMFTDIVKSTEAAARIGDTAWTAVAGEHWRKASEVIGQHGGRVWKPLGDGLLASFPTASQAVRAGQELVQSLASLGMQLRVGIHLGEVTQSQSDLGGLAVNVASRVCGIAEGGSVYLTQTAHAAVEEDIPMVSAGSHDLRGLPGAWPLYKVGN